MADKQTSFTICVLAGLSDELELLENPEDFMHYIKKENDSKEEVVNFTGKVLIADDTIVNQQLFKTMLEETGLEVDTSDNGQQAIEAVNNNL